jgi:hypothetical protein
VPRAERSASVAEVVEQLVIANGFIDVAAFVEECRLPPLSLKRTPPSSSTKTLSRSWLRRLSMKAEFD